jgi:hypothetical protein
MATTKIQTTKNYRMFTRSEDNRPTDPKAHKKLLESMKEYGFLQCFPIVCFRDAAGNLIVKEGQHRLLFAETLGLPVYWVEEAVDFDIAKINCTPKTWRIQDYAKTFAKQGKQAYQEGMDFAEAHKLPIGQAFALLAGTTSYGNVQDEFIAGKFKVKDRTWADAVAGIFAPMVRMRPEVNNARFLEACMAVCRVPEFDAKRMLHNAERCRDKLVSYSTRDAYLDMMESVYNFGRVKLFGLKVAAQIVMRERNIKNNPRSATERKQAAKKAAAVA